MFKYILEQGGNINWMAIYALITFFVLFVIGVTTILRRNTAYIEKMSYLPLDDAHPFTDETAVSDEK